MLEWLGVTICVSSWKRGGEAEARMALAVDNPLQTDDASAERAMSVLQ